MIETQLVYTYCALWIILYYIQCCNLGYPV